MLSIPCPWCGPRDETEFTYGGDATVTRPDTAAGAVSAKAWHDFLYLRDNPCGHHDEMWHHTSGCRRWFKVRRHTKTQEVAATAPPHDTFPEAAP